MFDTIRDALTLGGETPAVDGVLLVGEQGLYPYNALGQKLYPRKEFFDEITAVFRHSGRSAHRRKGRKSQEGVEWEDI
jgi:hypothetical protein